EAELREFEEGMAAGRINPRDVKMRMAREIVTEFHNAAAAREAEDAFKRQFQEAEWPTEMTTITLDGPTSLIAVLAEQLGISKSSARLLITQGGVSLRPEGAGGPTERITDVNFRVPAKNGVEIRAGKLKFLRVATKEA